MKAKSWLRIIFVAFLASVFIAVCSYFIARYKIPASTESLFVLVILVFFTSLFVITVLLAGYNYFESKRILKLVREQELEHGKTLLNPLFASRDLETELRRIFSNRKMEIEQFRKMESYRKEYIGNVSHELKTPIFNIQGYILTLLDGGLHDERINVDYLKRAEKSVDRMITIVEDLQTISQLETGELELEPEKFDIVELIQDVIDAQDLRSRESKINIIFRDPPQEPVFVFADKFRIRQVLVNLVVNSVRYGKPEGETRLKVDVLGEKVRVEVADNGIGIKKEHLPRIFERFYRVDNSRSRELGGTGLGLSIVKHIIEGHRQAIDVISTEGAGSVFSFPLQKD
jgi:two-component system, OmpR family, phosphate regulon sensor histidine kinase PhoR